MSAKPVPTTREELSFKVIEAYEKILNDCCSGLITMAQADYAVKILIAATGWCIQRDVFLTLSDWKAEPDNSFLVRQVFISKSRFYQVIKDPIRSEVRVYRGGTLMKRLGALTGELDEVFDRVCGKMLDKFEARRIAWPEEDRTKTVSKR